MERDKDLFIKNSAYIDNLSTRTLNILERENIGTIQNLLSYHREHGDFLDLEHCGRKTSDELLSLCEKYKHLDKTDYRKVTEKLRDRQKEILGNFFILQLNDLSKRTQGLLNKVIEDNHQISNIADKFLNKVSFNDFKKYDNVGAATIQELMTFQKDFSALLLKVYESGKSGNFSSEVIKIYFGSYYDWLANIWTELSNKHQTFPLFKFWNLIIKSKYFYNNTERYIFLNYFNYYKSEKNKSSLGKIGDELGLTRERVRQVRNEILKNFFSKFSFLEILKSTSNIVENYEVDIRSNFVFISDSLVDEINNSENTNFTKLFIAKVFHFYCKDTHNFLGYELNYHSLQQSKKHLSLKNPYLFSNELLNNFQAKDFINDISKRIDKDIKDSYTLNLRSFISRFCKSYDLSLIESLEKPCKLIINREFDLLINLNGEIVFERNKEKFNYEIIAEALEKLGYSKKGHHITEINKKVNELYPEIDYSNKIESLRGIINNYKSIFIHIGRSSTYALKKWERDSEDLKGGTIRDIVEELLFKKDKPQHISVILKYVNQYRDTTKENVSGNLKLDESKTFQFFGNGFIGLNSKNYKNEDTNYKSLNGFVFAQKNLEKYLPDFYDELISNISSDNEVMEVQVKPLIDKKINEGDLVINQNEIVRFKNE